MKDNIKQLQQSQSIKITKSVLRDVGEGDKININYSPIMIVNEAASGTSENTGAVSATELQELVWTILENLPEPKLKGLHRLAVEACRAKHKTVTATAEYLGLTRTYVSAFLNSRRGAIPELTGGEEDE